ncbi:hypothetical protein Tco_0156928 [Tanacetum coccineum]
MPKEVSNFAPPVIEELIKESRDKVTLAKVSSQPHSTYESATTLAKFELNKILIDKMEKSVSYLASPEHRDCYDSLKKSYDLDKDFFFSYNVYSLKRGRKDKDKDEDPSAILDRGLKKRKTSKDAEPTTGPKNKDSTSSSSKGTKSQPKPSGKSVQSEEPVFEVADSDMPQDQEGNPGDNDDEPRKEDASRRDWFKKPTPPQEPTNPDWHEGKTPQKGPTQKWLMTLAASTSTDKSLKDFDELMSTPIDFSGYILNGLKIKNLTQEILLGPAFRLLKGTRSNYAELEYDFEECYKALSEKLDWENPEGGDYPFDLSKPLPLITRGKRQRVPFEYFINNDLKYLEGGVSTMTYTASTTKTKAAQYDLPSIEDMVPNIWSPVKVAYDKYALWVTHVKNRLTNLLGDDVADFAIALRMFTRSLVIQKRVEDLQLGASFFAHEGHTKKIDISTCRREDEAIEKEKSDHFTGQRTSNKALKLKGGMTRTYKEIVAIDSPETVPQTVDPHEFEGIYKDGDRDKVSFRLLKVKLRCISRIDSYFFKVEGAEKHEIKVLIFKVGKLWWLRRRREIAEYREVVTSLVGDAP